MPVTFAPFDPLVASREEWGRLHAYRRVRHAETEPQDPLMSDEDVEAMLRKPDTQLETVRLAVLEEPGGTQVGKVEFEVFRPEAPSYKGNEHVGWAGLGLLASHRRMGLGRLMLRRVAELAREKGSTTIQGYTSEPDGMAFARAVGARVAQERRESRLDLAAVDWGMVEAWASGGRARNPETRLVWLKDGIDDSLLPDFCGIYTEVFNEQPFGDLELQDVVFTPEAVRESLDRYHAARGTWLCVLTREADGATSGITEMGHFPSEETMLRQFFTGVRERYRGRGLGKWIKAEMLLRARKEFPRARIVSTGNASSNESMLSINDRLGYRLHRESIFAQISLADLEAYLNRDGG